MSNTDVEGATYGPWAIRRDAEGRLRVARIAEEPDWSVVAPGASVEARDPDGLLVSAEVVERTGGGVVLATRGVGGRRVVWAQVIKAARNGNAEPGTTVYVSRAFSPSLLGEPSFVLPLRTPVQVVGFSGPEQDEEHFGVQLPAKGVRTLGEVTLIAPIGRFPAGSTMILPFTEAEISSSMRAGAQHGPTTPTPRVAPDRDPTQVSRPDSAFDNDDEAGWASLPGVGRKAAMDRFAISLRDIAKMTSAEALSFTILTSWKDTLPKHTNQKLFGELIADLQRDGYVYRNLKGQYFDADGVKVAEKSVLIFDMPKADAQKYAEKYAQDSYIYKDPGGEAPIGAFKTDGSGVWWARAPGGGVLPGSQAVAVAPRDTRTPDLWSKGPKGSNSFEFPIDWGNFDQLPKQEPDEFSRKTAQWLKT